MLSSYELLNKIISNAPHSMFAMDRQHRFILTNPAHLQIWGLTEEQLIGHTEHEAFPQESAAKLWADNEHIMSTGQTLQLEEELLLKNGQFMNVTTVKFPFHDKNGKVIGLCGIATDISSRKQAEQALRTSESTYRSLFDNMLNGLAYCRMVLEQGQPVDFVYIKVNTAFEILTGLHNVIGRKVSEVIPGFKKLDPQLLVIYGRVALTGQPEHLELFVNSLQTWFSLSIYSPQTGYFVAVFDVITKQKEAELALKESEQRLRLALDAAQLDIFEWDLNTNQLFWPSRTQELFGYRPGEFSGNYTDFSSRVHPEDLPKVEAEIARSQKERNRYYCEFRVIWPDGSEHWITGIGEFTYDSKGQPLDMRGTVEDITQRKLADQELLANRLKLEAALASMNDAVFISNTEGQFIDFNDAFAAFHKFSNKAECLHTLNEFTEILEVFMADGELAPLEQWAVPRALRGETASNVEYFLRRKDTGENWTGSYSFAPIRNQVDKIIGAVVSARDITEQKRTVERLREAEAAWMSANYLRNLIETSIDPLLTISLDGKIIDVNTATEAVTGWDRDKLIGSNFEDYFTESMEAKTAYQQVFLAGSLRNYALKIRHRDGHLTSALFNATVYRNEAGQIAGVFAAARDITELELIEQALKTSEALFKCMFNEAPLGIALIDSVTGQFYEVNPMFAKIADRSIEEIMNIDWMSITHPDDLQEDLDKMALLNAGKISGYTLEKRYLHRDGTPVWINKTTIPIYVDDKAQPRHLSMIEDISERKISEDKINQLAFHDPLTQLPNRRLLLERLKHSINVERRDGKQLALLMLDLDRFKIVNDSLGHLAGDELLQQVAERITARLRDVDMVARLGGDEFIVLLEDIAQPEDAARVANEIIADLTDHFCLTQRDNVQIGTSIGISLYPLHGTSPEILLDHADAALYQAKDAGRGCFAYFSEELTLAAQERITLERRLRQAIAQQQFRVFYQPQINIISGRIVGLEALIRWQDPLNGLLDPHHFIAIAEESGLIVEMSAWVLYEACRQGKQWLDKGYPPLTIAVNVSPHQLRRNNIGALVTKVLAETGFPANQLELEITESGLMESQDKATAILNELRALGVRLAIDDFGTGYSSLSRLKHFPLDVLKIDKSFIDNIPFHQDDIEIAATIVGMAHTLGLKVLAEGVETTAQLAFLQEKGCDMYQGFIRSQPVSAEEMTKLLDDQQQK
jgi:diguanylate cyclase (GGDEF)-like protein/PAS domain S-box-containing protein